MPIYSFSIQGPFVIQTYYQIMTFSIQGPFVIQTDYQIMNSTMIYNIW